MGYKEIYTWDTGHGSDLLEVFLQLEFSPSSFHPYFATYSVHPSKASKIWKLTCGQETSVELIAECENVAPTFPALSFCGNQKMIALSNDDEIILWSFDGEGLQNRLKTGIKKIITLSTSSKGNLVACGNLAGEICILDSTKQRIVMSFKGHDEAITDFSFSSDGKLLLSGSEDGHVKTWEMATGNLKNDIFLSDDWDDACQIKCLCLIEHTKFLGLGKGISVIVVGTHDDGTLLFELDGQKPINYIGMTTPTCMRTGYQGGVMSSGTGSTIEGFIIPKHIDEIKNTEIESTVLLNTIHDIVAFDCFRGGDVFAVVTTNGVGKIYQAQRERL